MCMQYRKRESKVHSRDTPAGEDDIDDEEHFLSLDDCLEGQHGSCMASGASDMPANRQRVLPPRLWIAADVLAAVQS